MPSRSRDDRGAKSTKDKPCVADKLLYVSTKLSKRDRDLVRIEDAKNPKIRTKGGYKRAPCPPQHRNPTDDGPDTAMNNLQDDRDAPTGTKRSDVVRKTLLVPTWTEGNHRGP